MEKVWGGRRLTDAVGIDLPGTGPIGETWEIVDRADHASVVAHGDWAGATLPQLIRDHRAEILGRTRTTPEGRFPLLVKFLDASEPLSMQVHPPSGTRGALGEGKSEAWYLLDARPDSRLWLGLHPHVTREALASAANTRDVLEHVIAWPARRGEITYVPGGTVHAIGGGIALLEVQENADTTHRFYDWDRVGLDGQPRPVHVDAALASTTFGEPTQGPRLPPLETSAPGVRRSVLVDAPSFGMELHELDVAHAFDTHDLAGIYVVLDGAVRFESHAGLHAPVRLVRGDTWLIPAAARAHTLTPEHVDPRTRRGSSDSSGSRILRVTTRA